VPGSLTIALVIDPVHRSARSQCMDRVDRSRGDLAVFKVFLITGRDGGSRTFTREASNREDSERGFHKLPVYLHVTFECSKVHTVYTNYTRN